VIPVLSRNVKEFWRRYSSNRMAVVGLAVTVFFVMVAFLADFLAPFDPLKVGVAKVLQNPILGFPMGSDHLGRDILSGVIYGARVSLLIGFAAAGMSALLGILIGAISGYLGGNVDAVLMRITEIFQIVPSFFLAILLVVFFGASVWNVTFVIGMLSWPRSARLLRAEFLSMRTKEFVQAARSVGEKNLFIIFSEVLPNAIPPVVVNTSLEVGAAIITEAALAFFGLSDPSAVSWGMMLRNAQTYLRQSWWTAAFPGICIFLLVAALNLVGDGLNDALNPRLKER